MPTRAPSKQAAPAETIEGISLGYNGYTSPTLTKPQMWTSGTVNIYSGAFQYVQRARFANVYTQSPATSLPYTSLKYFALPGVGAYLMGDQNGKLYSYDTSASYAQTQRFNPYVDPSGSGSAQLNGPWSRESLQNILYEMNGQVKQAGRNANAATIEGWGLDAPDTSPQIIVGSGSSVNITGITRASGGTVTATFAGANSLVQNGQLFNVTGVTDATFNGTFTLLSGSGSTTWTWIQIGQNSTSSGGNVNISITKAVGRSYVYAWENANKAHVGAPSPATQYILYSAQQGQVQAIEAGTVTTVGTTIVTGTNTFFTSAWVGRSLWMTALGSVGRIVSVQSPTQLTLASPASATAGQFFQIYDPQATHLRFYATADGGATYLRFGRQAFVPSATTLLTSGLQLPDNSNAEPPNFPFTTETAQFNNVPPPIGSFVNEYQGALCVYGVPGAVQTMFYSNQTATSVGLLQESFAPLNQITFPIANSQLNGMIEFPGSAIIWSDKQDMFRLTGLLTDNTVTGVASGTAAAQQGATIARLPYNLGCASPFAAEITPLGGFWLTSNSEIWLYTDRYAPRNIGRPVQDILNSISPSSLSLARAKYYHTQNRNWIIFAIPANSSTYNNTLLILDLDLLASNGSPSYFTFDMATNSPSWYVFQPGTIISGNWVSRCDSLEAVYEAGRNVRALVGQIDLIQDLDFNGGTGTEISVPNGTLALHAYGNDSAVAIKRPTWIRFNTNRDPSMLASDGWAFQVQGIDDDFYTFQNPLQLFLTPGVNDSSTLGGNPDLSGGAPFRHSPELFRVGGVNFVMGRRLKFLVTFPSGTGTSYQFRAVQLGFGVNPPS